MKEIRILSKSKLRDLCIENRFYTCGSDLDYKKMMRRADYFSNITLDEISLLAIDIVKHSDNLFEVFGLSKRDSIKCVASLILNNCCRIYVVD